MNRFAALLVLVSLIGCTSDDSDTSPHPVKRSAVPDQLIVQLDINGNMHVNGYYVSPADLPELLKQWHVKSAIVSGMAGSKFSDALKIQSELKDAGVPDVSIATQTGN